MTLPGDSLQDPLEVVDHEQERTILGTTAAWTLQQAPQRILQSTPILADGGPPGVPPFASRCTVGKTRLDSVEHIQPPVASEHHNRCMGRHPLHHPRSETRLPLMTDTMHEHPGELVSP